MGVSTDTQMRTVDAKQLCHKPLTLRGRGLVIFVVCFIASAVVIHIVVWRLYRGSMQQEQSNDAPRSALISQRPPPAGPALQPSPAHEALPQQDLAALRAAENAEFAKRGWLDESTGGGGGPGEVIRKAE